MQYTYYDVISLIIGAWGLYLSAVGVVLLAHYVTWRDVRKHDLSLDYINNGGYRQRVAKSSLSQVKKAWFEYDVSAKTAVFNRSVRWSIPKQLMYVLALGYFDYYTLAFGAAVGATSVHLLMWDLIHVCTEDNQSKIFAIIE